MSTRTSATMDLYGPLNGIRVVDLTTARSGPTCVRQLVDMGAESVRVCAPHGTDLPGSDGWNLHRGTRSITADLTTDFGREVLLRLVARSDVLVENYRPGVKHRLRIDPDTLWETNPSLIYGSISGFGQEGPYADRPGVDQIVQGMSGIMSVTGPPGSGPWRTGIAISDTFAGTFLAQAIVAALFARTRTGKGQWVHTSLLESMINVMDFQAARFLNEGVVPEQAGNDHPTLYPMGTYPTADGFVNVAVMSGFERFAEVLRRARWCSDDRYATNSARIANRDQLDSEIRDALATGTTQHWVALLNEAGFPAGPVYTVEQCFADEHVAQLKMTEDVSAAAPERVVSLLRHPVTFMDTPPRVGANVPRRGEHTDEILAELGL